MSCLYCQESTGRDRAAVAVCTDCGSAVCRDHAVIRSHRTTHVVGPGQGLARGAARLVRCTSCDATAGDR